MLVHFKINWKPWHYEGIAFEKEFWTFAQRTAYFSELLELRAGYSPEQQQEDARQYKGLLELARQETDRAGDARPLDYTLVK